MTLVQWSLYRAVKIHSCGPGRGSLLPLHDHFFVIPPGSVPPSSVGGNLFTSLVTREKKMTPSGISPIFKAGQFSKLFSCDHSLSLLAVVLVIPPLSWVILVPVWGSLHKPIRVPACGSQNRRLSYTCRKVSPPIFSFDSPDKHALILPECRPVPSYPRAYQQHQTWYPPSRMSHPCHHRAQENNCRPTYHICLNV